MKPEKNLVIVKILGGLGNQMFQYAYGRTIAEKYSAELKLDTSDFKNYEFHNYSLNHLNIIETIATEAEIALFKKYKKRKGRLGSLLNFIVADETIYVEEPSFSVSQKMLDVTPPCYVEGYFQSEQYFEPIKDIIRREFTLKTPLSEYSKGMSERIRSAPESVSLHIRRGDFAKHAEVSKFHGICPPEYYEEAIRIMNEQMSPSSYFVFSDDIEWAKEHIQTFRPTEFIGQGADKNYEDLELMSLCKHHILSNSSFGWWGAWLSERPDRGEVLTITPTKWIAAKKLDTKDLIPPRWKRLPY